MGTQRWKSVKAGRLGPHAVARARARAEHEVLTLTLKQLRQDLEVTQAALARAADMTQSEMSRLESRDDHRVSSLRRYVQALGGEIEVTAIIGGRRIKLTEV